MITLTDLRKTCLITVLFFPPLALVKGTLGGLSNVGEVGRSRSSSATGSADGSALIVVAGEVDFTVEDAATASEATAAGLGAAVDTSLRNVRV